MAKILKLGMTFNEGSMPDFGSIDMNPHTKNIFLRLLNVAVLRSASKIGSPSPSMSGG